MVIVLAVLTKKITIGLLVGYVLVILGETVLFRTPIDYIRYKLQLFWSYEIWEYAKAEMLANIFVYTPVGVFAGRL